jgi:uncharacterized membrane protein
MPRRLESVMHIGRRIGLSDDKGVTVAVFVALVVIAAIVVGYYFVFTPLPEPYNSMAILDINQQAKDYPSFLVANQNSTFGIYLNVTNHMNQNLNYRVETKITENLPATFPQGLNINPIDTYEFGLENGESSQQLITITKNEVGDYSVVFELWQEEINGFVFTGNYCVLKIRVSA